MFHVLIVALREGVSSSSVGDKIQLLRARWIRGGFDRGTTGIGDGPGRQAVDDVGVIGRRLGDLALGERVTKPALAEGETVNDGGIRFYLHFLLVPIGRYRGYARALLGFAGLFLDDGCEDNELLGLLERQVGIAPIPVSPHEPLLRLAHALDQLLAR